MTEKVDAPESVNAVADALCPWISELRGRHSQRQMTPRPIHSANISKCQVSDCDQKSVNKNKDNEKSYQIDKRFLFTIKTDQRFLFTRLYTCSEM